MNLLANVLVLCGSLAVAAEEDRGAYGFHPGPVRVGGAGSAQRRGINAEAKLLFLEYAFETLCVVRVDLKTAARNERSQTGRVGRPSVAHEASVPRC